MKVSPLRNIVRREIRDSKGSVVSWEVLDTFGHSIPYCTLFIRKLEGYKPATKKRYVEVLCKFIDFLYECNILGCFADEDTLPSRKRVNEAIESYIPLLLRGSEHSVDILISDEKSLESNQWKVQAFRNLNLKPCKRSSLDNVIAPINLFLRLSELFSLEAQDMADALGIKLPEKYDPLINAVQGFQRISSFERAALRAASLLGGVIRMHGEIKRPAGLKSQSKKPQRDQSNKDFPVECMNDLLASATNWRDRALWTLLLASGIRKSEAMNLQWADIDYENQKVFVLDPEKRPYGSFIPLDDKLRYKGRYIAMTAMWDPWRTLFFKALAEYKKREWRLPSDKNQYVFQKLIVEDSRVGDPLLYASDAAINQSFKQAVIKAGLQKSDIDGKYDWTPHSLRHAYGVYMLNYIPISPGKFGLHEAEVQMLMGHTSILSTRKYARRKEDVLIQKLRYADQIILESMDLNINEITSSHTAYDQQSVLSINKEVTFND